VNTRNALPDLPQLFTFVDAPAYEFSVKLNFSIEEDRKYFECFSSCLGGPFDRVNMLYMIKTVPKQHYISYYPKIQTAILVGRYFS